MLVRESKEIIFNLADESDIQKRDKVVLSLNKKNLQYRAIVKGDYEIIAFDVIWSNMI